MITAQETKDAEIELEWLAQERALRERRDGYGVIAEALLQAPAPGLADDFALQVARLAQAQAQALERAGRRFRYRLIGLSLAACLVAVGGVCLAFGSQWLAPLGIWLHEDVARTPWLLALLAAWAISGTIGRWRGVPGNAVSLR